MLHNADGVGDWGCNIDHRNIFRGKKGHEGVRFNVISVTKGSNFQEKALRNT